MKVIYTETGFAALKDDGSMVLDNSGYKQHLDADQVKAAWNGEPKLPLHPDVIQEMKDDGLEGEDLEQAMKEFAPFYDGEYWDFGEELHIIPSNSDFDDPDLVEVMDELPEEGSGGY